MSGNGAQNEARRSGSKPGQQLTSGCAALLCALALLLSSCAEESYPSAYIGGSRDALAGGQAGTATSDSADVTIQALIEPNGPGSWVKDAPWYEAVFLFHNRSAGEIEVTDIKAVNHQGAVNSQMGPFSPQFFAASQPPIQPTQDPNSWSNSLAMIPVIGLPFMIGTLPSQADETRRIQVQADDAQKAGQEYQARQVRQFKVAAGGSLVGSAFFPRSSGGIEEIVFSTKAGDQTGELRVQISPSATSSPPK